MRSSRYWISKLVVLAVMSGGVFLGHTASANSVELSGDIEVVNGDPPYNDLQLLRIGAGQMKPPNGTFTVSGGAFVSDYHAIYVGGYFPLDPDNNPIPKLSYRGVMTVEDGSTVELGGGILVGAFARSRGELTVSGNSVVRASGGIVPIEWLGFPEDFATMIGFSEGARGEVVVSDNSELSVGDLRVGNGAQGTLRIEGESRVIAGPFMNIARLENSDSFVEVMDSTLHIVGNDMGTEGAFLNVGRGSRGELLLVNSVLLIDGEQPGRSSEGGFQLGREPTGHGTFTLVDSAATVRNMKNPFVAIGRAGFGSLTLEGNSTLIIEDKKGDFAIASERGGVAGSAVVSIGATSLLDAGDNLLLCLAFDGATPTGTAEITVDGTLRAVDIRVGPGCTIDGTGTIEGNVTNLGGVIGPDIAVVP